MSEHAPVTEEPGWKVCCRETCIRFSLKDRALILKCPHGQQVLGLPSLREAEGDALAAEAERNYAQGRMDEFLYMKSERPIDPIYWDMHHERALRAAKEQSR